MPIRVIPPPAESVAALKSALKLGRKGKTSDMSMRVTDRFLEQPQAHPVYAFGLGSFAQGQLGEAKLVGWQYLTSNESAPAVAEVYWDPEKRQHSFGAFNQGTIVDKIYAELATLSKNTRVAERQYELRLLRIPAVYVVALWLKDVEGDVDVFVSVGPEVSPLPPGHVYSWSELRDNLRGPVEERIQFDRPIKSQPGLRR